MTTTQTAKTNTPGYNYRLAIFFTTIKGGKPAAFYFNRGAGRPVRLGLDNARMMQATDTADVLCCNPARPHTCGKA